MKLKKDRGRFTVRFDMENPDHVRAVEYLNGSVTGARRSTLPMQFYAMKKAATKSFPQTDRALIEQIVQEYLEKAELWAYPRFAEKRSRLYPRRQ